MNAAVGLGTRSRDRKGIIPSSVVLEAGLTRPAKEPAHAGHCRPSPDDAGVGVPGLPRPKRGGVAVGVMESRHHRGASDVDHVPCGEAATSRPEDHDVVPAALHLRSIGLVLLTGGSAAGGAVRPGGAMSSSSSSTDGVPWAEREPIPAAAGLVAAAKWAGVRDDRVLLALATVPRPQFLPPEMESRAWDDRALPIGHGQTTTQPSLVALMVDSLALGPSDRVLEVGTGTGYQAAVMSRLVAEVHTLEVVPSLARRARSTLEALGVANVVVEEGDGTRPDPIPGREVDAVIVAAATAVVPDVLIDRLRAGGRLVVPLGEPGFVEVELFERRGDGLVRLRTLCPAAFVPLVGRHEGRAW